MDACKWFIFVVLRLLFGHSVELISQVHGNDESPLSDTAKKAASIVEMNLIGFLDSISGIGSVNVSYYQQKAFRGRSFTCIPVDELALVEDMAVQLDRSFERKVAALRKLKARAEETVTEYKYDPTLKGTVVSFVNMKTMDETDETLTHSPQFKQAVNFSASGVHIPLEIYEGYPDIQNGLKWSASLDEVFKNNYAENPDFGWQVFGSEKGYMRVYPANKWKEIPDVPDFYDVRRRPWYIQGSTSPKDMLILMDISGSVHGQTFTLMKIAVKTMLNTLEENDYVNVAWFNNRVGWVSCFKTFVQANSWNKKLLFEGIDHLKDANMSSYTTALEFAFDEFYKFNMTKDDNVGAECHQIIMLFTDGGTDKPVEILRKYNKEKNVRIFTYAIGPHAIPVHTIKWIACNNRGHFYSIATMGGIRTTVQEYPNILMRPMALSDSQIETWSTVYADAGNLGMVITVTLPVFNRSRDGNQSSVGVVGIDTPVRDIRLLTPYRKIGPIAYTFVINLNGFTILHPKMNIRRTYLEDAADVDFLDLEGAGKSKQSLRDAMIDGKKGTAIILTFVTTDDDYHIVEKEMKYSYTPIVNGSFSLGLALSNDRRCYMQIKGMDNSAGLGRTITFDDALIADWDFCTDVSDHGNASEYLQRLSETIKKHPDKCNEGLVQHLLWDIESTKHVAEHWKKSADLERASAIFVGTEGGLLRFYPNSESQTLLHIRDPFRASYYKKAHYYSGWTFLNERQFGGSDMDEGEHSMITAVRAVSDGINKSTPTHYNPAVVGVRLHEKTIAGYLELTACKDRDLYKCYLLDDGGFIVSSSSDDGRLPFQIGKFFGKEDPSLMHKLIGISVYKRRLEYKYHTVCTKLEERISSATRINNLMRSTVSLLQSLFHVVIDNLLRLMVYDWTLSTIGQSEASVFVKPTNYTCNTVRALYYFMPKADLAATDDIVCGNCSRKFSAVRLAKTNLLLLIAEEAHCPMDECADTPDLMHEPTENVRRNNNIKHANEPNVCEMAPRYRRRPRHPCFARHPDEDSSECGAGSPPSAYTPSIYYLAFVTFLQMLLLSK